MKQESTTNNLNDITQLLSIVKTGDRIALDQVFQLIYQELKVCARRQRFKWQGDATLNTTALINEAYLKLVDQQNADYENRLHFLSTASKVMRHILIDYSRSKITNKRGGREKHQSLLETEHYQLPSLEVDDKQAVELLSLDCALSRLAKTSERESKVVECRFFGGMTINETSELLGVSPGTVKRDWTLAQSWLLNEMERT